MARAPTGILGPFDRLPLVSRSRSFGLNAPLTASDRIVVTARMSGGLSKGELETIASDRNLAAMLNRAIEAERKHFVSAAQRMTRKYDLLDTHLLLSSWGTEKSSDGGSSGLKTRIALTNSAPYTWHVRTKKRFGRRFLVNDLLARELLPAETASFRQVIVALKPRIAAEIARKAKKAAEKAAKDAARAARVAG